MPEDDRQTRTDSPDGDYQGVERQDVDSPRILPDAVVAANVDTENDEARHILGLDTHDNDGPPPPPGAGHYERLAYNSGLAYVRPALTDKSRITAGYIRDVRPVDFDENIIARTQQKPVAIEEIHSSVSGKFIDDRVFADSNILLEILQNAEPKDSKGTWFDVEFFAKGKWRRVTEEMANFKNEEIEKLRILDNGKGYMPKDMTTLGGGKRLDAESAGQFGSGMKISDRSALGRGVKVTRYSRNWKASPHLKPVITSAGEDATVSYNVQYFPHSHQGSVVEYESITPQMIDALRKIQDIYLPLDKSLEERLIHSTPYGLILKPKEGGAVFMVKGRSYVPTVEPKHPLMYSYDLHDCRIDDQNRHFVDTGAATQNIYKIWGSMGDKNLFLNLFKAHNEARIFHEHKMDGFIEPPEAFGVAAKEYFEITDWKRVYLDEGDLDQDQKELLKSKNIKPISIPNSTFLHDTLHGLVSTGKEYIERISVIRYLSGKVDDYEEDTFASTVCRAISEVDKLSDKDKRRIRMKFRHAERGEEKTISYVEFIQSGDAYKEYQLEGMIIDIPDFKLEKEDYWIKDQKVPLSIDDFIHRFDPLITAFLAGGIKAKVTNDSYELEPAFSESRTYGRPCLALRNWSNFDSQNFSIEINVDNAKQASELKELHKYSLELNPDYKPLERTADGDVVEIPKEEGVFYENGVKKVKRVTSYNSILSYNFKTTVDRYSAGNEIEKILNLVENEDIPVAILTKARDDAGNAYLEYGCIIKGEKQKAIWRKAFEKVFGGNGKPIVLDDVRDLGNRETTEKAKTTASNSDIESISVHYHLVPLLKECGVPLLSVATKAERVLEYIPDPAKEALMEVSRVADKAIERAFKEVFTGYSIPKLKSPIHLVKKLWNAYGQEIKSDNGYIDPLGRDPNIYVFDGLISNRRIDELITFLLISKIEAYRGSFEAEDFLELKGAAMGIAERTLTSIEFIRKIRLMIFNKRNKTIQLVERAINEMENDKESEKKIDDVLDIKPEKKKREKMRMPNLSVSPQVRQVLARTALAVAVLFGGGTAISKYGPNVDLPSFSIAEGSVPEWLKKLESKFEKDDKISDGFNRPNISNDIPIGVSVERSFAGGSREAAEKYGMESGANFLTTPNLRWGYFMSEKSMDRYNGKSWEYDNNAPDFAYQNFDKVERFAHYQKVGKSQSTILRTRAGGVIDPKSIKVIKDDGSLSEKFSIQKLSHGEYELKVLDSEGIAVTYQTLNPSDWHEKAETITDADFAQLDPSAYAYYTHTPDLDINKIRFKSILYPEMTNLGEFVSYLKTLNPIERVNTIRAVIGKMRYTITEKTETAFRKFHSGQLPEKDFLEFIMNSNEIENPGDGDCDVQNSLFALMSRYAGIPTKLDFVLTEKNVAHAPASIFLPKIGWILSDTMGERSLIEEIGEHDRDIDDRQEVDTESTEEAARKKLIDAMQRRTEYMARKCYEVQ